MCENNIITNSKKLALQSSLKIILYPPGNMGFAVLLICLVVMELDEERRGEGSHGNELEAKMTELVSTKEELKRARDHIMQSWLDSKPLIDELERRKSGLRVAESRCSSSDAAVSELNSQLENIYSSINSKKEELAHARNRIDELKRNLDQIGDEMETNRRNADEKRARSELGRVLKLRRQTLRRQRLHLRAVKLESEASEWSRAKAVNHLNSSRQGSTTVQLTHEEYYAMIRKAEEKSSLADQRISASMEKKDRRRKSLLEMEKLKPQNRSRKRRIKEEAQVIGGEEKRVEGKEKVYKNIRVEEIAMESRMNSKPQKPLEELMEQTSKRNPPETIRIRPANHSTRRMMMEQKTKRKKKSIFIRIRSFFMRRIMRLFG